MRNPWVIAQFSIAALLLAISLVGVLGVLVFDAAELAFSFQGGIQAFAVFPGLVLSLIVNALLMRAGGVGRPQKVLLVVEFVIIAALLLFHFYTDPAGTTFGLAIAAWPVVIVVALALAIVSIYRVATRPRATATAR